MALKIKFAVSLAIIAFLLLAGCGPAGDTDVPGIPGTKEPEVPEYEYELIEDTRILSQEVVEEVQELKTQKGYFPLLSPLSSGNGEDCFLLISSGRKPTGGYSLALKSLEVKNGKAIIIVEEKEPEKDKAVIQVITYPFIVLKIDGGCENYEIRNTAGEIFSVIIPDKYPAESP